MSSNVEGILDALLEGAKERSHLPSPQDPSSIDPFFAKDPDVLKTYAFECAAACAVSIQGPRAMTPPCPTALPC